MANTNSNDLILLFQKCVILFFVAISITLLTSCDAGKPAPVNTQKFNPTKHQASKPSYVATLEKGDYENALKEIRPLAEKGDVLAQMYMAKIYSRGLGVSQNYKEAAKWWFLAAKQGNSQAQYNMACCMSRAQVCHKIIKKHSDGLERQQKTDLQSRNMI